MQPYVSLILVSIRQGKAALRSCDKNGREQCRLSFSKKENQQVHSMKFVRKKKRDWLWNGGSDLWPFYG